MSASRSRGYESDVRDDGNVFYLVGDEWVSESEAAEYAQAEADALYEMGDDGYPAAIAPRRGSR